MGDKDFIHRIMNYGVLRRYIPYIGIIGARRIFLNLHIFRAFPIMYIGSLNGRKLFKGGYDNEGAGN